MSKAPLDWYADKIQMPIALRELLELRSSVSSIHHSIIDLEVMNINRLFLSSLERDYVVMIGKAKKAEHDAKTMKYISETATKYHQFMKNFVDVIERFEFFFYTLYIQH